MRLRELEEEAASRTKTGSFFFFFAASVSTSTAFFCLRCHGRLVPCALASLSPCLALFPGVLLLFHSGLQFRRNVFHRLDRRSCFRRRSVTLSILFLIASLRNLLFCDSDPRICNYMALRWGISRIKGFPCACGFFSCLPGSRVSLPPIFSHLRSLEELHTRLPFQCSFST